MGFVPIDDSGSAPPAVKRTLAQINNFKGADLTSSDTDMDIGRSPDCPNMIRSEPGKIRKRMGFHLFDEFDGRINGALFRKTGGYDVHAGTKLYYILADGTRGIYAGSRQAAIDAYNQGVPITDTGMADRKSFILTVPDGKTDRRVIFDGEHYRGIFNLVNSTAGVTLYYAGNISDSGLTYVPTVMIGKNPDGTGGEFFEEMNSLSDAYTESFCVTSDSAAEATFKLTFKPFTDALVKVKVMAADGETWEDKTENTDFTVDRENGTVTFINLPGATPSDGKDNVKITPSLDHSEQRSRIDKCTVAYVYGDTASGVRVFCTGNPDYPNRDFWSAINDPTYFPDVNYSTLGRVDSAIVGYSEIGGLLAAHKDEIEGSIYVRQSEFDGDGMQQFAVKNIINGRGALCPHSFARIEQEPLFLTPRGIYAITAADLTQEKYEQVRSHYLNGALTEEANLADAYACVYKDYYMLAVNSRIYILDGTTREYSKGEPYSGYQYEGFYFTDINARALFTFDDKLYFGDADGHIYVFYDDEHSLTSYSDAGNPISAYWQTPALSGSLFYKNKNFKRIAIQLVPSSVSGLTASVRKRGIWSVLFSSDDKYRYFDFSTLDFSRLSFATDSTARTVSSKIKVKKVDKASFRFANDDINTPFSISNIAFEFVESGNYKG